MLCALIQPPSIHKIHPKCGVHERPKEPILTASIPDSRLKRKKKKQAVFACWITDPANRILGRRGVIFWSCFIAGAASIWEAFTYSWPQLFVSRLALGLGIGPKVRPSPPLPFFSSIYSSFSPL
jgi:hypothetical protein